MINNSWQVLFSDKIEIFHHVRNDLAQFDFAQLAGAVEYTDCFSAEG